MDTIQALVDSRGSDYGDPRDDFPRIRAMYDAWDTMRRPLADPVEDQILCHAVYMVCVKLSRLAHSGKHRDSWVDIQGYAECALRALGIITPVNEGRDPR